MLRPRADTGRGAQAQRIQPWCPGSASLPFLLGSQTPSPPGSSRSLLLLSGLSLQSRDSSPPDKPVAPAGAGREGQSLEERRWEKEGEQQAGRATLNSFMPCWAAPASCSRSLWKGWTGRWDTEVKLGYSSCKHKAVPWVSPRTFPKAHHHLCAGQVKSNTG